MPDGIPLVVGGYKATEEVEDIFERCPKVNIIVRGEGEDTIKDIMNGVAPEKILGISYRNGNSIIHNACRPLPDVNTITPPDRRMRRNNYYMVLNNTRVTAATFDTILSARGCPFNCRFCTFSLNPLGQKRNYAARTAESVVDEIESIAAGIILFSDDNFFTEPERSEKICDLIIERGLKKRFVAQARIEVAQHPRLLEKAVRAGFKMLLLGIESPHDHILKSLNKGFNQAMIRRCFTVFGKYPIFYHGNYIYGNIGETEAEMLYMARFSKEIKLDTVAFSKLRADKFSPLRDVITKTPGYYLTDKGDVYSDVYSRARLKKIHRRLKFSFYTPLKILQIVKKFLMVRFFTFREVISFVRAAPFLLKEVVKREVEEKRFGNSLKLILIRGGKKAW
jgi:magnesium-protoporphyrin IX monomethyl ester (oxidative) cyclase